MSAIDFAPRVDVRNAEVVRELDRSRARRLWLAVLALVIVVVPLLAQVQLQMELTSLGYAIEDLERQQAAEQRLAEHLKLEHDTLRAPARLKALAPALGLAPPAAESSFVIERVTTSTPPDGSVVAAR
jgi:cell division protein FtsL